MLFGLDKQANNHDIDTSEQNIIDSIEYVDNNNEDIDEIQIHQLNQQNQSPHFTQKLATGLEKIVKGFYEGVVQIIYQLSTMLF